MLMLLLVGSAHAAVPRVEMRAISEKQSGWSVDVRYPQLPTATAPAEQRFNDIVRRFVLGEVARFKKSLEEPDRRLDPPWGLWMVPSVHLHTRRWISIKIAESEYTGGAHPNPSFYTLVYDFRGGRALRLQDLFRPGTPYLQRLASLCRQELARRPYVMDRDWAYRGAAPQPVNYQWFYLKPGKLVVLFPPYQVGPYAQGTAEIGIPLEKLRDIAARNGPLYR
jgi:hypothetical protein